MSPNPPTTSAPPGSAGFASPPITIVLTSILLIFFFVGLFSLFFCRCFMDGVIMGWNFQRTPSGNLVNPAGGAPAGNGLDPSLIELFPTFTYSNVKDLRKEKYDLECAICLAEISDDDLLRLLTVCYHCFHKECIDLWLESHKTCPVCRGDLDLPREALEKNTSTTLPDNIGDNNNNTNNTTNGHCNSGNSDNGVLEHAICITIDEDTNGEEGLREGGNHHEEGRVGDQVTNKGNGRATKEAFSRSHSTGHSIVASRGLDEGEEEDDKYTLRLPEHVMKLNVPRRHGTTLSCISFGEFTAPGNIVGSGEASGWSSGGDVKKQSV